MTISLGNTVLCAGQARSTNGSPTGPDDLVIAETPGVVDRNLVGADRVLAEHIRADSATISFRVVRIFPTAAAALDYTTHTIYNEAVSGALKFDNVVRFANAAVTSRIVSTSGCAAAVQYTIKG